MHVSRRPKTVRLYDVREHDSLYVKHVRSTFLCANLYIGNFKKNSNKDTTSCTDEKVFNTVAQLEKTAK